MKFFSPVFLNLFVLFCLPLAAQQQWKILPESHATFEVENIKINTVRGEISGFEGTVSFDAQQPELSRVEVSAAVNTIETGIQKRDEHLMKAEFFNVEKYPRIQIVADQISFAAAQGKYHFTGTLNIKGHTREISFSFISKPQDQGVMLEGGFSLKRKEFDLGMDYGNFTIDEEVNIEIKLFLAAM
jgi:polyisoprenoid-binding protein YceI